MKLLLTILLFTTLTAKAQEAFLLGKSYPVGSIVWYPYFGTFYKSKSTKAFTAKITPDRDAPKWERIYYPAPTPVPTQSYARQSAFDSLLVRVQQVENRPQPTINRSAIDSIYNRLVPLEQNNGAITFRVSNIGIPLLRKVNENTYSVPSIILGEGLTGVSNDSTTKIEIKK